MAGPTTPQPELRFGLFPLRSPLLWESLLISFPLPTEMFQFGRSRFLILWIQIRIVGYYSHWVAPFGYLRVYAFFQLTGAFRRFRVLLRLLIPRHPPIALNSLTIKFSSIKSYEFSPDLRLGHYDSLLRRFLQASIFVSDFFDIPLHSVLHFRGHIA